MKKNLKIGIVAFVLGAIIFSGITGVAAYSIFANSISYTPKNSAWKVNNVEDALDSLYISKTSDNYSTDEKVVGTWIDGKPVYQKVISFSSISKGQSIYVSIDSSIDEFINCFGKAYDSTNIGVIMNIPAVHVGSLNYQIGVLYYNNNSNSYKNSIRISMGSENSTSGGFLVVQYTKTTDNTTASD